MNKHDTAEVPLELLENIVDMLNRTAMLVIQATDYRNDKHIAEADAAVERIDLARFQLQLAAGVRS